VSPASASVSVAEFERAFPVMTELGLRSYESYDSPAGQPMCEAIEYRRGAFATVNDGLCGNFTGDGVADRMAFDQTATLDLATLKTALGGDRIEFRQIVIVPEPDGSVGAGSYFAADSCDTYFYEPGWMDLAASPQLSYASKGIDANWYKTDFCP
jgi:hypothetical protein